MDNSENVEATPTLMPPVVDTDTDTDTDTTTSSVAEADENGIKEIDENTIELPDGRRIKVDGRGGRGLPKAIKGKPSWDIEPHLISFVMENPFFAEISRWIRKVPTLDLPTAGVTYDNRADDILFYYNPDFFAKLTREQVRGVFTHEFYHLIFQHVTSRRKTPHMIWNIGTDLCINSIIIKDHNLKLPDGCFIPGELPGAPKDREMTEEEKKAIGPAAQLIASFQHGQASDYYFEELMKVQKDVEKMMNVVYVIGDGQGGMDDHSLWDDVPEGIRDLVAGKVKAMVERAVKRADATSNGWGNIPQSIREEIRRSVSNIINWRAVLRQFIGFSYVAERSATLKRVNKRYPYIHPGTKRKHQAKIAVAIDQSGSVDDRSLEMIFSELRTLTKKVSITVIPFDTMVNPDNVFEWRKGQTPRLERVACGGTDFNAPTDFINNPANRGRWDGLLIASDGECGAPGPCRIKRGYIIVPGRKLLFGTTDTIVQMEENGQTKYSGAWR